MPANILGKIEVTDRKRRDSRVCPEFDRLRSIDASMGYARSPNKAPEPTAGSVTPRATLSSSELKRRTDLPIPARGVPAPAVAHL